jgi:DnaJ-class molecular chaperone
MHTFGEPHQGDLVAIVLVVCKTCEGSGDAPDGLQCRECKGGKHFAVDRTPSGGIPEGEVEWHPPMLATLA